MTSKQCRHARSGLSLVEVMISATLSALLLIATATAWSASTRAVENDDQVYRSSQAARVAMLHMTTEIRRCQAVQSVTNGISVLTFDNHNYTYRYVSAAQQLQLVDNDQGITTVMANNVSAATFTTDSAPNPQTQISCVVRVAINITVTLGTNSVTLNGSAAPRVNINY